MAATSLLTAEKISADGAASATIVATRRSAACVHDQRSANGQVPRDAVENALVRRRARVPLETAKRAVDADEAALEFDDALAGRQMDERVASALHVIRMHELQERPRHELLARVAQHALERRVQPLEVAVETGDAEQVGREIEELAQPVIRRGHGMPRV
jgi:hypothetical protein